ncbi:hypothetical protein DH2020_036693 [Rehmannia glutinosa]|uniref:Uncharacterized protein n=1 Tax=Rehmannia glutinosa TaxID=99300 RepID=A0ABR0V2Z4_REHGL
MEEKEDDFGELCAEILENWSSPIYTTDSAHTFVHQNPFSLHHHQLNPAYDIQRVKGTVDEYGPQLPLSCTNVETKIISKSELKNEDSIVDSELEDKEDAVIPLLVADTFFDTLLGRGVDGIDVAALNNKVEEDKACDHEAGDRLRIILNDQNDAVATSVSTNNGKLNSGHISSGLKEGPTNEVKLDRGIDECLTFVDSKDVIIEIVTCDSVYENELRREHTDEDGVRMDAQGAKPLSDIGNTPHINCRMINGDKMLPFPMDSYSAAEDMYWTKPSRERKTDSSEYNNSKCTKRDEQIVAINTHSKTYMKTKHNYQSSYGKEMAKLTDCNEIGQQHSSRKERNHSPSHVGQKNQKRVRFCQGHQTNHHKLDINLVKSLCSPRDKMENYVSEGVKKKSASGVFPTNSQNSEIKMEVEGLVDNTTEEDPEKLKRRRERFKLPLPILKNAVANKSMEWATDILLLQGIATMDSDIKDQRPTRRRKWTSS